MNIQDYFCTFVLDPKQNKTNQSRKLSKFAITPIFFLFFLPAKLSLFSINQTPKQKKISNRILILYSKKQPPSIEVK